MNQNKIDYLNGREIPLYTIIKSMMSEPDYVNLGIIKKIHNENYVDVALYYKTNTSEELVLTDVRLLHIGTTKCKLIIQPAIGDNVIILTPKDFVEKLVYNQKPMKLEDNFIPYSSSNCCAVLIKDESDDNVKTTININENGDISVETDGNCSLKADGNADVEIGGNAELKVDGDAEVEVEGECSLKSESDIEVECQNATVKCDSTSSFKVNLGQTTAFEVGAF